MASTITLVNLTGILPGVQADETGINIKSFKAKIEPEIRKVLEGCKGLARGFYVGPMKLNVTIDGEVMGSTGVMAATATTALTIANSTAYFGAPTTGLYLTSGEVSQQRDNADPVSVSIELEALDGIP